VKEPETASKKFSKAKKWGSFKKMPLFVKARGDIKGER